MPLREYVCAPRIGRCRSWGYILLLLCLTVALWIVPSRTDLPYPLVFFFFSLLSLTVAMLLISRCCLCRYVYRLVATENGGFDFVVDEVRRLRTVCVCRIEVEALRAIELIGRGHHTRPDFDWQVYGNRPLYLLTMTDGEETVTARISPDAMLVSMLTYQLHSERNFQCDTSVEE